MTDTPRFTRRTGLKLLAPLLAGGGTALAGIYRSSTPAVAVSDPDSSRFEAADAPTVERNDGRVSAVTVAPEIDVDWRNFGDGIAEIRVTLGASVGGGMDVLADVTIAPGEPAESPISDVEGVFDDVDGTLTVTFETIDATAVGDAVTTEAFGDPELEAEETATTTVELYVGVEITGNEGEFEETVETATFDVTVRNPDGESDFGGRANPDAA
ncbi:hypothetical protein [Halalkaliarchaeum desulfuricum]|uniref:hypothetical protein n=1 Tax=Halalkaliarchaeum desulfuricum TaxID=2055893 RepID=UPI00105AB0AA|nr:hypothetical protein [Halalkaliarchaeum desulfuricum]